MKRVVFSETIAASDLKVSRCRHIIEFMKVCQYYWPKVVYIQNSNQIFSEPTVAISTKSFYDSFQLHGNENLMT